MSNRFKTSGAKVFDREQEEAFCKCHTEGDAEHVADLLNARENRVRLSELDQLAVDYYASGRKLKIQLDRSGDGMWIASEVPDFSKNRKWRRKPTTESQTFDVFREVAAVNGHRLADETVRRGSNTHSQMSAQIENAQLTALFGEFMATICVNWLRGTLIVESKAGSESFEEILAGFGKRFTKIKTGGEE